MSKINWSRTLLGGFVAAIILFCTDGFLHEQLLGNDWKALYNSLGAPSPQDEHNALAILYFGIFELGRGLISIFIYVLMRPMFAPGPKTATLAGIFTWFAFSIAAPAQFIPLGFYSNVLWAKVAAFQFVTSIAAAIAGAALYKDSTAG